MTRVRRVDKYLGCMVSCGIGNAIAELSRGPWEGRQVSREEAGAV